MRTRDRMARLQRTPGEGLDRSVLDSPRRRRLRRTRRPLLVMLAAVVLMVGLSPMASANPIFPSPNDVCKPADNPAPEQYGSGTDGLIKPPDYPNQQLQKTPVEKLTYYDRYGTAGQTWYAVDMGCADAMALMGNGLANTVFTAVRAIDRTTISVYQAAASDSLLGWLKDTVDGVITDMGKTFNARYWSWVVILGAMWLAWWGLVRKRASKVTEGVVWMVVAMVALVWLIARPSDFTTLGTKTSEATSAAFNAALPQSGATGGVCIPPPGGKPDPAASQNLDATSRNANRLWVALVCKPWLQGEFGTTDPNAKVVKENADKLLWAQAVDLPETYGANTADLGKKADAYKDVSKNIKDEHPGTYPLYQGKNWENRLAVAFGGLLAALVAGLLIMVIAIALIVVKIAFLLLLVAGPIFLGIGIHPGIGRVIAVRWLELLLSMLLKQAALIGVLSLLLWAYGLILSEALPWGLQILLIALVTFAAFIYRKPFQHLFSAVGYSAIGARDKSEAQLNRSVTETRRSTAGVAAAMPGAGLVRWAKREATSEAVAPGGQRDTSPAAVVAADRRGAVTGTGEGQSPEDAPVLAARPRGGAAAAHGRSRRGAPPLNLPSRALGDRSTDGGGGGNGSSGGGGEVVAARPGGGKPGGAKPTAGAGGGTVRPASWSGRGSGGGGSGGGVSGGNGGGGGSGGGSGGSGGSGRSGGGGAGSSGGSGGGNGSGNGGGGGWFSGRSSGAAERGRARPGGGGGSGGGGGGGAEPESNVPRPRGGSAGGGTPPRNGPGGGQAPPPLWGKRGSDASPPIPFWLRPVDRPPGERDG